MPAYLSRIVDAHRAAAVSDARAPERLLEEARACPPTRPFRDVLAAGGGDGPLALIAEIKRRSPSRGELAPGLDPAELAMSYAGGGAAALSVLTDAEFFGGSPDDLAAARAAVGIPALRKDFTVAEADVCDARIMGADAVLLIVAALDDGELRSFGALARELGLAAVVEVHDESELERALDAGADVVGVNQRDLATFTVDHQRAVRMAGLIPEGVVKVGESGIRDADDARSLRDAGYQAILVGETLVTAGDPGAKVRELLCL